MWTPNEIRKLIALITGIILAAIGILLLFHQVQASGNIKINMNIINGEIESGSAGMLLLFFSFFIIVWSTFGRSDSTHKEAVGLENTHPKNTKAYIKRYFFATLFAWVVESVIIYAIYKFDTAWTVAAVFVGIIVIIVTINFFYVYISGDVSEFEKNSNGK